MSIRSYLDGNNELPLSRQMRARHLRHQTARIPSHRPPPALSQAGVQAMAEPLEPDHQLSALHPGTAPSDASSLPATALRDLFAALALRPRTTRTTTTQM